MNPSRRGRSRVGGAYPLVPRRRVGAQHRHSAQLYRHCARHWVPGAFVSHHFHPLLPLQLLAESSAESVLTSLPVHSQAKIVFMQWGEATPIAL